MIACPACGFEAPDDFAFCPRCATPLAAAPPISEERKVVTTLFCDLVAFTAMSEAADPEDVDRVLGDYFPRATKAIESHGGAVEKFIGDAVVGVFGVPAVHEDDPERAVRAALRILEALEGLSRPDGSPLEARCGVNTGEALVRRDVDPAAGRGFVTGDAVNTAARLEAAAPPGGVAVGALTHELTERVIVYEALPPVDAKGKSEPVPAWRALRPLARTGLRTAGTSRTPFVDRDRELAALLDALTQAEEQSTARFVLVVGEPGIGKSRLTLELFRLLDARPEMVTWRQGRCLPYGEGLTFWALGDVLKQHAGILDSDDDTTVEAKLKRVLPDGDDRPWLYQRLRPLIGLDSSRADRGENYEAWARFLELVAGARPAVVVLEDLHWADASLLAFVDHVLDRGIDAPLLIVATTRPELLRRHSGALTSTSDDGPLRRIDLRGLADRPADELVTALLGAASTAAARAHVARAAGGNPFYAEQVARLLGERGLGAEGVDAPPAGGRPRLPRSLEAVLAARMDTLPPPAKALLSDAAVLGETFWRGGLVALSGAAADDVDEGLSVLLARDFIRPVAASTIEGEPEYLFWHALSRDAAYGQLPRKARAKKHEAAAGWIERCVGDRGDEFSEIVAHHYTTALDLARASGEAELADPLVPRAVAALTRAGERALRLDVKAAERYLSQALELAGADPEARVAILPRWAKLLLVTDRYREADDAYGQAVAGLLAAGDIRRAALAMCWQADARWTLGEPALELQRSALYLLSDDGPSPELAEILAHYALALGVHGDDPQLVVETAERAIGMSRSLGLPEPAVALSTRGLARLELGDLAGEEDCRRAEQAAQEQGLGIERSTILMNHTGTVFATRGPAAGRDALVAGREFVSSHGLASYAGGYRSPITHCLFEMGEWDDCLADIADGLRLFQSMQDEWDLLFLRSLRTMIAAARGDAGAAGASRDWLAERGRRCEIGWARSSALLAVAMAAESVGERAEVRRTLEDWLAGPRAVLSIPEALPQVVRTAASDGAELADVVVAAWERESPSAAFPLVRLALETVRAQVAELHDDREAALAGFAGAAEGWREFATPYEEAHALLGQGRCLAALGRAPEAAAPLAAAREIFARLGATPSLREVDRTLARR